MMETKSFSVATVLTITTERCLCDVGSIYGILNWMTSDNLFTHQLPRASRECKPFLLQWFPELEYFGSDEALNRLDGMLSGMTDDELRLHGKGVIEDWIKSTNAVPEFYKVRKIPQGSHSVKNPISELAEMVDPSKIVVIETEQCGR